MSEWDWFGSEWDFMGGDKSMSIISIGNIHGGYKEVFDKGVTAFELLLDLEYY